MRSPNGLPGRPLLAAVVAAAVPLAIFLFSASAAPPAIIESSSAGPSGIAAGPAGNPWFTKPGSNTIGQVGVPLVLFSTGAGPGGGPHVKLFSFDSAGTATQLGPGFLAYDPGFTGGVQATLVRAGGDLFIVTGAGPGGGPHVRLFKVADLSTGAVVPLGTGFYAYDPGFTGGVQVTATTDTAGNLLIVTGAGPTGSPHVNVFRVTNVATGDAVKIGDGVMAYDRAFTGGVNVSLLGQAPDPTASEIQIGTAISPVPLDLQGKDPALVGLGSYIVNAQAGCNECHVGSTPNNMGLYLAGGSTGPNLTPDVSGLPAGFTLQQFFTVMRNGLDDQGQPILEPMPVRIYKNMTDGDITAIYEFLRSIPTQPQPGP